MSESIFGSAVPTTTNASDAAPGLNLGTRIRFNAPGQITGIRWRFPDTLPSATITWRIDTYHAASDSVSSGNLASGSFTSPVAGTYVTQNLGTPLNVANADEIVVYLLTPDRYVATSHFFDSDVNTTNSTAPADDAGTPRRNGRFVSNSVMEWPSSGFNASGYHVDVVFVPNSATTVHGTAAAALGGLTAADTGQRKVHGISVSVLGGAGLVGRMAGPAPVSTDGGSWYQLVSIIREGGQQTAYEKAIGPLACPNDGEPLVPAGPGQLRCPYDGYRYPG